MLFESWIDLRYAARALCRSPAYSLTAIATIAIGVGMTTGIFTVLNGLLFRDLPARDGHELVSVFQTIEGAEGRFPSDMGLFSTAEYETYRERSRALAGILGHSDPTRTTLGGDAPQSLIGLLVTCNYFDVLGQQPALGRGLTARDCAPGASPIAVLSHELWASEFGSDPNIIGRTLELNRQLVTVVGVAAAGTYGGVLYAADYFAPISAQPMLLPNEDGLENPRTSWLLLIGRRGKGVSLRQARAELEVIAAQIDADEPGRRTTLVVERSTPLSIPPFRRAGLAVGAVVMAAFGLVLLIACMNVANLMLARASVRARELALRVSLGASRARVVRQLLSESVLIALAGGMLGSLLAMWSFRIIIATVLPALVPVGVPMIRIDSSPDIRVLIFALAVTAGAAIVSGLVPALRSSHPNAGSVLKDNTAGAVGMLRHGKLRATLVGVQVAMCMILMISAGLLLRGLYATQVVDPGFEYRNVAVVSYDLLDGGYDPALAATFQQRLLDAAAALPGTQFAALADQAPLEGGRNDGFARLASDDPAVRRSILSNWVSADYFDLLQLPILQGRAFTSADLADDSRVAIVTQTTAERYWPGRDPVGQSLLWRIGMSAEVPLRIVGVAADAEVTLMGQVDPSYVYLPASQGALPYLKLLVRSRTDFASAAAGIRSVMTALDPGVAATITPLESNLDYWRRLSSVIASLATSLGALALALAAVGIYGLVAYFVTLRFREIGIRVALGAHARDVLALVLRETMRPVAIGAVIGIGASLAVSRVLERVLFGVSPADPLGLCAGAALVLCVTMLACLLAGRRAVSIDPMIALRHD